MPRFNSKEEYQAFLEKARKILVENLYGPGYDDRSLFFRKNEDVGKVLYALTSYGLQVRDTGELYLAWINRDADPELAKAFYNIAKTATYSSFGASGASNVLLERRPSIKQLINSEKPSKLEYELRVLRKRLETLEFSLDFTTDIVREIVEEVRRRPRRRTTSLYIDERLWEEFKRILVRAGLGEKSAHRVLELLIAVFIDRYLRFTESVRHKRDEYEYGLRWT